METLPPAANPMPLVVAIALRLATAFSLRELLPRLDLLGRSELLPAEGDDAHVAEARVCFHCGTLHVAVARLQSRRSAAGAQHASTNLASSSPKPVPLHLFRALPWNGRTPGSWGGCVPPFIPCSHGAQQQALLPS